MTEPLSNRPKITQKDISKGYVMRYFVQNISIPKIIEVDERQYNIIRRDPYYKTIQLKWMIGGNLNDIITVSGQVVYGTKHQNLITVTRYEPQMPGLSRVLQNTAEYFNGVNNK
jgi:hypothetical protein